MMATISSLIVNIAKDTKELRDNVDKGLKQVERLERSAKRLKKQHDRRMAEINGELVDVVTDVRALPDTIRGTIKDSLLVRRRRTKKGARQANRKKKR